MFTNYQLFVYIWSANCLHLGQLFVYIFCQLFVDYNLQRIEFLDKSFTFCNSVLPFLAVSSVNFRFFQFQIRRNCVKMCGYFHESVRQTSIRYLAEMKRHNYVTPTSYLALILTFKSLLTGKRDEILNLKTRYEMGLGKLEFASNQASFKFSRHFSHCKNTNRREIQIRHLS